jgi:mono/diheme cytochrome c family protein
MRKTVLPLAALPLAAMLLGGALVPASFAQSEGSHPPVPFTDDFLADEANLSAGRAIWEEQCQHCHGKKAYPGKAPKLQPRRYKPDFVYRRVTDGFRKMPPWKDVYSDEQRMQVTAYILSSKFSP